LRDLEKVVSDLHLAVGIAVIATNLGAGLWGAIAWLRQEASIAFWYLLRAAQAVVVLQTALGLLLLLRQPGPPDALHLVYGMAPLLVTLVSEGMRAGAVQRELADVEDIEVLPREDQIRLARGVVRRESAIMSVGALVIVGLALRAAFTGG
jgi:hypothetical protein